MNRTFLIGLLGVAAIAAAIVLTIFVEPNATRQDLKQETQAPAVAPELPQGDRAATTATQGGKSAGAREESEKASPTASIKPTFDVVRINPQGDAVIAGRAAPGAAVTVLDGGESVGTVTADQNGEWVLVPEKPLPAGDRELSIVALLSGGEPLKSEDVVVLAVPPRTEPAQQPLAVLVPREGKETRKVLQVPSAGGGTARDGVSLDVVDYDEQGNVRLSGKAAPGREVLVYLDNDLLGGTRADGTGRWELRPKTTVAPGLYRLRVDEVQDSKVVARIELPFSRAAPLTEFAGEAYIVVQPGNSLWRIARRVLGQGTAYSVIYQANKDQIRDADLIYPGQVFAVPKTN